MAQRSRSYTIRYGGWPCGTSQGGALSEPAFTGVHSCVDETHPGPPYNDGGPLLVKKKKVFLARSHHHYVFYNVSLGWYSGTIGVRPYIPPVEPTPLSLSGWGARGWNRTYPLHPIYQLGVSIGELKDFPGLLTQTLRGLQAAGRATKAYALGANTVGELLKRYKSLPKRTGDAYLYGAFGIAPMFQDLLFLLQMQEKLDKKLRWLRRKNGKSVRRKIELDRYEFSENIARSIAPSSSVYPSLSTFLYAAGQTTSVNIPILKSYQRRIWFSVKWRIRIPEFYLKPRPGGPFKDTLSRELLGLEPNISVIYKLIPWSWLLDWFTSVGSVISNMSNYAKYGVVAQYAYVMCEETYTYQCPGYVTLHSGTRTGGQWIDPDWSWSGISKTIYEFRNREVANPYGFGITWSSLTDFQWSILTALGLSRGGKSSAPRT
jgi:hypothetical protein